MTTLYNRHVSIEIGKEGEEGRRFEELFIAFEVAKSNQSNANTATVSIYNLNARSRDLIGQEGAVYILRAGYFGLEEDPLIEILSVGNVEEIVTEKTGSDVVTKLTLTEDGKKLRDTTVDLSFGKGANTEVIVNEMASIMGVTKGTVKGLTNKVFNSGASVSGKVKDRMDEIVKNDGLDWSIQNGELQILPRGDSTDETAVSLTNDSGLLTARKIKFNEEDQVNFKSLLNPSIKIGRKIYIKNREIDGFFVVQNIKYVGDNKSGPFYCEGNAI